MEEGIESKSLNGLVESGQTAVVAAWLIYDCAWGSLNYGFQPHTLKQLGWPESGMAINNDVVVKEGDRAWNAGGSGRDSSMG